MSMRNIGLLIPSNNYGGAERVACRISNILDKHYNIFFIVFEDSYDCYKHSGKFININVKAANCVVNKIYNVLIRVSSLKKIKNNENLDLVISFMDSANIVNILSRTKFCKTFVSVRNYTDAQKEKSIYSFLTSSYLKFIYNKADRVIPVSKVIADILIKNYRVKKEKIMVLYNPYDIEQINQMSNENIDDKYNNFFEGNSKIFVSMGRQMYQKGFWHLIKAFYLLYKEEPNIKLAIIGEDYQNGKCKNLAHELGLDNRILFTGNLENPFSLISRCSVYVLTSLFEGFPNALAEAMACGCPVIATDCKSGPREILFDNPNFDREIKEIEYADYGVIIPKLSKIENWTSSIFDEGDKVLANAMKELINNNELIIHYREKSKERMESFSYEICKNNLVNIIDEN